MLKLVNLRPISLPAVARAKSAVETAQREYDTAMRLEAPLRIRRLRATERLEAAKSALRAALGGEAAPIEPEPGIVALDELARRYEGVPCDVEQRP